MRMSEKEKINHLAYAVSLLANRCWSNVGFGPGSDGEEIVGICDAIRGLETTAAAKFNQQKHLSKESSDPNIHSK